MSYKTILVHVNESRHCRERIRIAADLAISEGAHLIGAATVSLPGQFYPLGMYEGSGALNMYLDHARERADKALAEYEAQADRAGASSYEKRMTEDEAGAAISLQARYSDLVVLGQTDPDEPLPSLTRDFPEYVIMNCGRPVLMVPYAGSFEHIANKVLIAWNSSPEATRAVAAALPFLKRASAVQVAVFNPKIGPNAHGEQPGADIALYLARHGVKVEVSRETTESDIETGAALLSKAADFGADLLVMGCYGHPRLREMLAGGVTRTILQSMTVPTLMAH